MTEHRDMASVRRRLSVPERRLRNSLDALEYEGFIRRVDPTVTRCTRCGGCGGAGRSGYVVTEAGLTMLGKRAGTP